VVCPGGVTLGLPPVRWQQGANIKAVSQRVGRARTSITIDIYAHVLPEQAQDVSEKVGAVLFRGRAQGAV
jgi:hypothetical protein